MSHEMTLGNGSSASGTVASSVGWIEGALLGTSAIVIAVIAVASVGGLMLTGRVDVRRGAQVMLGCFILFGASAITAGIAGTFWPGGASVDGSPAASAPPVAVRTYPPAATTPYDPYAGAALPSR